MPWNSLNSRTVSKGLKDPIVLKARGAQTTPSAGQVKIYDSNLVPPTVADPQLRVKLPDGSVASLATQSYVGGATDPLILTERGVLAGASTNNTVKIYLEDAIGPTVQTLSDPRLRVQLDNAAIPVPAKIATQEYVKDFQSGIILFNASDFTSFDTTAITGVKKRGSSYTVVGPRSTTHAHGGVMEYPAGGSALIIASKLLPKSFKVPVGAACILSASTLIPPFGTHAPSWGQSGASSIEIFTNDINVPLNNPISLTTTNTPSAYPLNSADWPAAQSGKMVNYVTTQDSPTGGGTIVVTVVLSIGNTLQMTQDDSLIGVQVPIVIV